jgi:Ser/Thr protein kinase RdoA (MazF antagonist)
LTPDLVLAAVDAIGFESDGRLLALNSFENRVYQVGVGAGRFVVAKFYRPGRWSDAAIEEEHGFAAELVEAELPVVAPLARGEASERAPPRERDEAEAGERKTLFQHGGFRYAVFPRVGGRAPELEHDDTAAWLGRTLARIHMVGARRPFRQRAVLDVETMVRAPSQAVLASALLPPHVRARYERAVTDAAVRLRALWGTRSTPPLRLHGDCHPGNVLWTESAGPLLVDLDDSRSGPAIQDLWMLLSGAPRQQEALLDGYAEFRDFDVAELDLIPALRLMRQIHFAGWIAERWRDPAFPRAFPFAADAAWWERHVQDLAEQLSDWD